MIWPLIPIWANACLPISSCNAVLASLFACASSKFTWPLVSVLIKESLSDSFLNCLACIDVPRSDPNLANGCPADTNAPLIPPPLPGAPNISAPAEAILK